MAPSLGPPSTPRWPFQNSTDQDSDHSEHSDTQVSRPRPIRTDLGNCRQQVEHLSRATSPGRPVEGEEEYLAFVESHPYQGLPIGTLPANTPGPISASPQIVAASPVTTQGQSALPENFETEEPLRDSAPRAGFAVPEVSVKARIAAFESHSPTASTSPSTHPQGTADSARRTDHKKQDKQGKCEKYQKRAEQQRIVFTTKSSQEESSKLVETYSASSGASGNPPGISHPVQVLRSRQESEESDTGNKATGSTTQYRVSDVQNGESDNRVKERVKYLKRTGSFHKVKERATKSVPAQGKGESTTPKPPLGYKTTAESDSLPDPNKDYYHFPVLEGIVPSFSQIAYRTPPKTPSTRQIRTQTRDLFCPTPQTLNPPSAAQQNFAADSTEFVCSDKGPRETVRQLAPSPEDCVQSEYLQSTNEQASIVSSPECSFEASLQRLRTPSDGTAAHSSRDVVDPVNSLPRRRAVTEISGLRTQTDHDLSPRITGNLIQHCLRPSDSGSEAGSGIMDSLRPDSAVAMSHHRREAIRLAKVQESSTIERCRRNDVDVPEYTFDELIGKGSFGRVYKCRNTTTKKIVAVKVLDIDETDFHAFGEDKDEQIKAFNKEIRILRQAQESGAPNLNQMIEALTIHSQLWLVCEYCPGGSVKTLMRATNEKLSERYIVVVARELGKALRGLHQAGILHRDVKAANVLVHEDGRLQLCDFGVATVLEAKSDKRKTFIGTLHWMPPELWDNQPEYSDEVDVWAFGCTIYECAVGKPPNADLREPQQLRARMRRMNKSIELPDSDEFPEHLRSLVSYALSPDAKSRPRMSDVLEHPYLAGTEQSHPTTILAELVNVYYAWLYSGGQRASLFIKGGAVVSDAPGSLSATDDEWNFSTTIDFEKRISKYLDLDIDIPDIREPSDLPSSEGDETPKALKEGASAPPSEELTATQKANFEERVRRGATNLSNLFDQNKPNYEYKTKTDFRPIQERRVSDLPFRAMVAEDRPPSIASNEIDLGDFDSSSYATIAPTKLADAPTMRPKRSDTKLNREGSSTNVTPLKSSLSLDDDYLTIQASTDRPATQDFSFPPKEWKQDTEATTDTAAGVDAKKDTRKTMDWSFDMAMSDVEPESEEAELPEIANKNTKKHETMQWSFSQAMAETGTSNSMTQTTTRPAPMLRTMTMPVTSSELDTAEAELPRPSTALSEAYSEASLASSEADPFGLDHGAAGFPAPSALDQRGISSYYDTESSVLSLEHKLPYSATSAGPAPFMIGPVARIGEEGFPGPSTTMPATVPVAPSQKGRKRKGIRRQQKKTSDEETTSPESPSSPEARAAGPQAITLPDIQPPSADALGVQASTEEIEREFGDLLGSFSAVLKGAGRAIGMGRRRRSSRRSSSEWESEE